MLGGLLQRGRSGSRPRARVLRTSVPTSTGTIWHVPMLGLLPPVTFARTSGHANLSLNTSTGAIAAATALAAGEGQTLAGTALGSDGVLIPWTVTLTGAVERPAAPTIALAAGDGQITIAVTDGDNGGAPVTHHTLYLGEASGDLSAFATVPAAGEHVVDDLPNDEPVFVQVAARNSAGEGARSAEKSAIPVAAVQMTAPAKITTLTAIPGDGEAALAWITPDDGGSAITDYAAQYRFSPSGDWLDYPDAIPAPGVTIDGLTNGIPHGFRVAAVNAIGMGPWSDPVTATPEAEPVPSDYVPDVIFDFDADRFVITNADEAPEGVVWSWESEAGVIAGQTGTTLPRDDAPAGMAVRALADDVPSNWAVARIVLADFTEPFAAEDNTPLDGHGDWKAVTRSSGNANTSTSLQINGGVLTQEASENAVRFWTHPAFEGEKRIDLIGFRNSGGATSAERVDRAAFMDVSRNAGKASYIYLNVSGNGCSVRKVVDGGSVQTISDAMLSVIINPDRYDCDYVAAA